MLLNIGFLVMCTYGTDLLTLQQLNSLKGLPILNGKFTDIAHFQIGLLIFRFFTPGKGIRAMYSVVDTSKLKPPCGIQRSFA